MEKEETMTANELGPKRSYQFVLKCEGLEPYLIHSYSYQFFRSPYLRSDNVLTINLYEPLGFNACAKLIKNVTGHIQEIEISHLSELGEVKSRYVFQDCTYHSIESNGSYEDGSNSLTKVVFSFQDLIL